MAIVAQPESLEKRAMSVVKQTPASGLDSKLPNRPFLSWFNELIGQQAGVVWQLAECGAPISVPGGSEQDMPACAEANVILPNGNRMIVAISVGTFKKGIIGEPAFLRGVIESGEQLYPVRRLRDLPEMLRSPENIPRPLPDIQAGPPLIKLHSFDPYAGYIPSLPPAPNSAQSASTDEASLPPPPPAVQRPRKVSQGVLEGSVVTRRMPVYPASARAMNAFGNVEVRIVISEAGRVIEATAISGHPALRTAAMDAARQWVYKPTTLNGVPVKVETVLSFTFAGAR